MTRRTALAGLALGVAGCRVPNGRTRPPGIGGFLAFSLREAERRHRTAKERSTVGSLAGISRLIGVVHDPGSRDWVLAGHVRDGAPGLALDDLVAAIRARLIHREWPLVSIDKTPDTKVSGKQVIRFEGGVARTAFGRQLLDADIVLKMAALGLGAAARLPVRSFFSLCEEAARRDGSMEAVRSRLWFHPLNASLMSREEVFVIRALSVGVRTQVLGRDADPMNQTADSMSDRFAAALTANYPEAARRFPEVARLASLFNYVAIAKGIESGGGAGLDYWLREYSVPAVETPSHYQLVRRESRVESGRGALVLEMDGGVDTRVLEMRLRDGDHTAFRQAVLESRPSPDALWWPVPLRGWPGALTEGNSSSPSEPAIGSFIDRRVVQAPNGQRGGLDTRIEISPDQIGGRR
jgi:hypothetical protein